MKKLSLLLLTLTLCFFTACHKSIWAELENLDQRVTKLEELCKEMNTNITSLQTIVSVLQSNDYITGIVEIKKNGEVIGYTITFGKHDPITIYHGQDGKDGQNGTNGSSTPVIGVAKDTDDVYYWTLNGEWLLDDNGNKLPVSGKGDMPKLKIEEGYWYVSYDNGVTWAQLGKATGDKGEIGDTGATGDSMFQSVTQDDDYVYFTLADGTIIKILKGNQTEDKFIFVVTYNANGGEGVMQPDTFYYGQAMKLTASKFINDELIFTAWNTKPDGSGIDFQDEQEVVLNRDIVLYAKWKEYKSGKFSVSSSKYVSFALGNLQYHSLSGMYRFAKNQYDCIGENSRRTDSYYDGWVDLFGWRWNYSTSTFFDYGEYEIDNYPSSIWRTLSKEEWEYILKGRTEADSLCGVAQVNGVNGLILLPDNWECPSCITFKTGYASGSTVQSFANHQSFTKTQWSTLESSGAVFLPAAGYRSNQYSDTDLEVEYLQQEGYYWTSTGEIGSYGSTSIYVVDFSKGGATVRNVGSLACSVRLVRSVK